MLLVHDEGSSAWDGRAGDGNSIMRVPGETAALILRSLAVGIVLIFFFPHKLDVQKNIAILLLRISK
ncbi:hypothetical protein ECTPHS_10816 [Ectothiorhodospira sp. PHS-1]|nr:hypothetical protein ECTPHS_10816 [Ectothiorhodospira sp. PHS-1]